MQPGICNILLRMRSLIHVLQLALIGRYYFIVTAIEPGCENCGCCVDKVCASKYVQGYNVSDFCTHGCIDGIGGNKCYIKCPDDCVTCEQTIGKNCATCESGKYLTIVIRYVNNRSRIFKGCVDCPETCTTCTSESSCQECNNRYFSTGQFNDCSEECPTNCKTCTSSTNCQECYTPFYNQGSTTNCSLSCPGHCVCSTPSICSSCQYGFFNVNQQCMNPCPDSCNACTDQNTCQSCKDGYYNRIEMSTYKEFADCSLSCREACFQCTSYDVCTECKQGHYGSHCQHNCSVGCTNGECATTDGACDCKEGFAGGLCDVCAPGRHGNLCNLHCVGTCKGMVCDRITGHCVSCKTLNITGDLCEKCINDMWGTSCSSKCPKHCDGQCLRNSGHCKSCERNFEGNTCNKCSAGYHGELCDKECPEQCYNLLCYRSNGTCGSCNQKYAGSTCEDCVVGFYGETCDAPCQSTKCASNICNRKTGACTSCQNGFYGQECEFNCSQGCKRNVCDFGSGTCVCKELYSGDKCCVDDGHCRDCVSSTACETCLHGYFGTNCDKLCTSTCAADGQNSQCEKTEGKCLKCWVGFYGDHCNNTCNDRCANNLCDQDNGHCIDGYVGDIEGPTGAQVDDIARIVGIAVGVSAATIVVVIVIVISAVCFILRRWKQRNEHGKMVEASYVNTEFQREISDQQENVQTPNEYEALGARTQMDETEYDEIK